MEVTKSSARTGKLADILHRHETKLVSGWMTAQLSAATMRRDLIREPELRQQSTEFLHLLSAALQANPGTEIDSPAWGAVNEFLAGISKSRARQGFTPAETATFVFSLKEPLFALLQQEHGNDRDGFVADLWQTTVLIDKLAMVTAETFQRSREEVIQRQQQELLELSTPVVKLWDGILAVPLIGTLDSARTQTVMESLLQKIVETGSGVAIIDITGVPTVDTLVAQHLIKTITAARLMGADCIISGIRPQIAQTIVHLGVQLSDVITKANLADAFALALERIGMAVTAREGSRG